MCRPFSVSEGDILHLPFCNPVVTLTGGELLVRGQSAPVVNGVRLSPGQKAIIVGGKLVITD